MHPENIKTGSYIVVIQAQHGIEKRPVWFDEDIRYEDYVRHSEIEYTGQPLKVLAYNPPFLAVTNGVNCTALDLRRIEVRPVTAAYRKALYPARRKKKQPPTVAAIQLLCPNCERPLNTRKSDVGTWILTCITCQHQTPTKNDAS